MNPTGTEDKCRCCFEIFAYLARHLSKVVRLTLQLALLVVFVWHFGLPAIAKYRERKVMVVESWKPTGGIPAPGVTIFSNNDQGTTYVNGGFEQVCSNLEGNETMENCIEKHCHSDAMVDVLLGYTRKHSLMTEQNIKKEFTLPSWGRYHSLDAPVKITPDQYQTQIIFLLSYHYTYYILMHDPNFFLGFYNPSFPMVREIAIKPNLTVNHFNYLIATEVEELNLPEDPCNPDPDYNFQTCFKESLSRQVGCRTSWDRWSRPDMPLCTNMDQFR
jgi:hypothetical protein